METTQEGQDRGLRSLSLHSPAQQSQAQGISFLGRGLPKPKLCSSENSLRILSKATTNIMCKCTDDESVPPHPRLLKPSALAQWGGKLCVPPAHPPTGQMGQDIESDRPQVPQ